MKKLLSLVALLVLVSQANAAVSVVSGVATSTVVSATPIVLNTLTISSGTNTIIRLYDTPYKTLVWTNTAYTNYTTYTTNQVTTFTDSQGLTNNFTNTVLYSSATVVAASTNNAVTPLLVTAVGANVPLTLTLGRPFAQGLVVSNDIPATVIFDYRTP